MRRGTRSPESEQIRHRSLALGAAAASLLAGLLVTLATTWSPSALSAPRSERSLPRFQGPQLGGGVNGTDQIGRRRAVIYVFSTTDRDADSIAGIASRIARDAAAGNISVLGVNRNRDVSRVANFVELNGIDFPIIVDKTGAIGRKLRIPNGESGLVIADAEGFLIGGFAGMPGTGPERVPIYENEMRRILHLTTDTTARVSFGLKPPAPNFRVTRSDGGALHLGELRGEVVVLVFFLPTCPHCHEALRFLDRLRARLAQPELHIVPVSLRASLGLINDMRRELDLELPIYVDGDSSAREAYAHAGVVPDIVVIDREGRVAARHRGSDPRIEAQITMEVRHALGVKNPLLLSSSGYSGESTCRICHEREHGTWSLTTHAYAFETLVEHGRERDAECVGCHSVGFGERGGYEIGADPAHLRGVQCESCHGRGGPHQSPGSKGPVAMQSACEGCHTPKHSLRFDFASRLPLVSHAADSQHASLSVEERQALLQRRDARERSLFGEGEYVGSKRCNECHADQYTRWLDSGHARALDTLRSKQSDTKADCMGCHVTGHGQPGGFPDGGDAVAHVGCESCHGPGSRHSEPESPKTGTILALADKCDSCVVLQICGSCHTDEWSPNFEFSIEDHIEKLRHGGPPPSVTGAE